MTRVLLISLSFLLLTSMMWVASSIDDGGGYPDNPRGVAGAFLKAYSKGDFVKAKEYITQESENAMDMVINLNKNKKPAKFKYKLQEAHEEGTEATVYYKVGEEQKTLNLQKEKGRWRVVFTKEDQIGKPSHDDMGTEKKKSSSKAHEKDAFKAGKAFLEAYAKNDYATAKKYVSVETESAFEMLESVNREVEQQPRRIEIGGINIEGDKATLDYLEDGQAKSLALTREGKYWLVAFEKSSQSLEELERALDSALIDSL